MLPAVRNRLFLDGPLEYLRGVDLNVVFLVVWIAGLLSGCGAIAAARPRPALAKRLLVGSVVVAAGIVLLDLVTAVLYAHEIPLDTDADQARLTGYIIGSRLYLFIVVGPLFLVEFIAFRRLRAEKRVS